MLARTGPVASEEAPDQIAEPGEDDSQGQPIIVEGKRWGRAEIDAEAEIGESEIASFAATTIGELLEATAFLVSGSGQVPEVLVNGRRIANPGELDDYPKEALARIAILPKNAAAAYGFAQGKRVVNLELKRRFATWRSEAGMESPTAGGRRSSKLSIGRFAIDYDTRWNIGATYSHDTELLKSERAIPAQAAVSQEADSLDRSNASIDPAEYEALLPRAHSAGVNASATHPFGAFSGTLNIAANRSQSIQKIGLPPDTVSRPLRRHLTALESRQTSESLAAGLAISGPVAGWQSNLGLRYSVDWATTDRESGYRTDGPEQVVEDGYTRRAGDGGLLSQTNRLRSKSEAYTLSLTTGNSIASLPAGLARASLSLNAGHRRVKFTDFAPSTGGSYSSVTHSEQLDGLVSFSLPLAGAGTEPFAALGKVDASATGAFRKVSGAPTNYRIGGAIDWSPMKSVNLRVAYSHENTEPTYDQLYAPRIEILKRVFDFTRGEYVQPLFRLGGNDALVGGSLESFTADLRATPFDGHLLSVDLGYRHARAQGGIASLPALTPEVEATFPERVFRNARGELIAIDARAINIGSDVTKRLTSGLSLRWSQPRNSHQEAGKVGGAFTPWTIMGSLTHRWELKSETAIRRGLSVIDRLDANGQARHSIAFHFNVGRKGLGANFGGTWTGAARVARDGAVAYRYPPSSTFNLGGFVELGMLIRGAKTRDWVDALKLSLDVRNLFDSRRWVESPTRMEGFSRYELDPLGRTIRIAITAQF